MAEVTITSYLSDAETLLKLEPEDLGAIIVEIAQLRGQRLLQMRDPSLNPYLQGETVGFPNRHGAEILLAIAEAWSWLQREGIIVQAPDQSGSFYVLTRRGQALKSAADVNAYRRAGLLPREILHPKLDEKVRPMFLRGDYDVAVFQAFKEVEIAVRRGAELPDDLVGVKLMRTAFHLENGKLTDPSAVAAEREAVQALFAGAIGHAKNPASHRETVVGPREAAQLIAFASYLLDVAQLQALLARRFD